MYVSKILGLLLLLSSVALAGVPQAGNVMQASAGPGPMQSFCPVGDTSCFSVSVGGGTITTGTWHPFYKSGGTSETANRYTPSGSKNAMVIGVCYAGSVSADVCGQFVTAGATAADGATIAGLTTATFEFGADARYSHLNNATYTYYCEGASFPVVNGRYLGWETGKGGQLHVIAWIKEY